MWQPFTERARRVILLGQEEAEKMNWAHVGTEHLLLGLILENEGVAARVLQKQEITLDKVRQEIEATVQTETTNSSSEPKLTPKAKRALELAANEARRMHHNYIGTEHLLLALLREKDGVAATVLQRLGFDFEKARAQIVEYLGVEANQKQDDQQKLDDNRKQATGEKNSMWLRFSEEARHVILLGQKEAISMNSGYVGTEHFLLGLILQNDGVAAQILQKHEITLEKVRQEIESRVETEAQEKDTEPKLTPQAKRVLELSADEARRLRHGSIDTQHVLLGLLREKHGMAAIVLNHLGLDLANARVQVLGQLGPEIPALPSILEKIMSRFSRE